MEQQYINLYKEEDKEIKLQSLYNIINGKEEVIDFKVFCNTFNEISSKMDEILPKNYKAVTYIDKDAYSLCNYYNFNGNHIFFDVIFDSKDIHKIHSWITFKIAGHIKIYTFENDINECINIIKKSFCL
jgi:hypothetical protein